MREIAVDTSESGPSIFVISRTLGSTAVTASATQCKEEVA